MLEKNILITGGAGFIGSNFIPYILEQNKNANIYNLDMLTYAGNLENLAEVSNNPRYHFIHGDICDQDLVRKIFEENEIDTVYHFAAESHVDNSISNPGAFIKTNIEGTFNLLQNAYKAWMIGPNNYKENRKSCRFLHVSTDEVYGTLGVEGLFKETTSYAPNSPYSASKASSDFLVRSYFHTYGLNVVTTNCSNNYGPKQHSEKLIPTIIRKAIAGEEIPIYGNGKNIRDWLFVKDHCKGILLALKDGRTGETYNIGGRNEKTNIDICNQICTILDDLKPLADGKSYKEQISFVKDRPGHDLRYAIDASKIEKELGWKADENFASGIQKTIKYYI